MIDIEYLSSFVPERFISDERYRRGHLNVLASSPGTKVIGMHTPEMKKVARLLVKSGEWREQLEAWSGRARLTGADGLTHEERMIWGLVIDYAKIPLAGRLELIEKFIPSVDNWAICDNFCCNAKWVEKEDKALVWEFVRGLIASEDEFRVRTGLVLALAHYLDAGNLSVTLETVAARRFDDSAPYYIRMAVAWLFAEALCKNYDAALAFIEGRRLSPWIHRKAIQKARESWRIDDGQKQELYKLR